MSPSSAKWKGSPDAAAWDTTGSPPGRMAPSAVLLGFSRHESNSLPPFPGPASLTPSGLSPCAGVMPTLDCGRKGKVVFPGSLNTALNVRNAEFEHCAGSWSSRAFCRPECLKA